MKQLKYELVSDDELNNICGKSASAGLVAVFGVVGSICIIIYKLYGAKKANITLPGGFKFEFNN